MDGVVAGYGGGDVLRGVTFTVPHGSITCVVGPNGAGKSTVMRVISGLLRPRLGTVTLRGEKLTGKSPREILTMGVVQVPQNHSLFRDMTVRENIELGGYILRDRALVARRLDAVFDLFPQARDWAGKRAGELSGGQQRLVEFARALMLDPALILLDEPSMGLSPMVLKSVFAAVRQMNSDGATILLVEQNARAGLRLSHHGVVMENGTVRLAGTGRRSLSIPRSASSTWAARSGTGRSAARRAHYICPWRKNRRRRAGWTAGSGRSGWRSPGPPRPPRARAGTSGSTGRGSSRRTSSGQATRCGCARVTGTGSSS